jgi:predicted phage terminase large subunit-like protein
MNEDIKEILRGSFENFFVQAFHHTHPDTELSADPYWRYVCHRYQTLKKGARIVINQPPRTLKSWTAKFYAAWVLGNRPSTEVMIISNTQRLSEQAAYDIRKLLRAKWYRQVFPRTRIATDRSAVNHLKTTRGGGIFAGSVEGSVAGFGADLLILDDPNKIDEASRPDLLEVVNQKFGGEINSRLNNKKKGIVVIVQHRLNKNDLSGYLIAEGYKLVALPLVAPRKKKFQLADGELWHRRKDDLLVPSAYAKKDVEAAKKQTNPDYFWFYQQGVGQNRATPFRHSNFRFIADPPATGAAVISIDPGQRGGPSNSYHVIQVWQKTQAGHHLFSQFREQCTFTDFEAATRALIRKWRPAAVLIENAANGGALLARMKAKFHKIRFFPIEPKGPKTERLNRHRAAIRGGLLSVQSTEDWAGDYIQEFVSFPADFTDQVDATTQYLDFMATNPELRQPPEPALFGSSRQINGGYKSPNIASARGSIFRKKTIDG